MNWQWIPLVTFLVTGFLIWALEEPAKKIGLVDSPGGRKVHIGEVPLIGGIAICLGLALGVLATDLPMRQYAALFAGIVVLGVCGVLDDLRDMRSSVKLVWQSLAALFMVSWGGVYLTDLGDIFGFGSVYLGNWGIPLTAILVVGLINAINMMDGSDGLGAGVSLVALSWLGYIAYLTNQTSSLAVIAMICSAVAAFLVFNLRSPWRDRASVFLGDSGSMVLGLTIAWFAVQVTQGEISPAYEPIAVAWILCIPVVDTIALIFRRIRKGVSPFSADREHLHHIFERAGFSIRDTVYILLGISIVFGGVGVVGVQLGVPQWLLTLGVISVAMLHFHFSSHAWQAMKILKKLARMPESRLIDESGSENMSETSVVNSPSDRKVDLRLVSGSDVVRDKKNDGESS